MGPRVVLYNPPSVFYTLPLGLLAVAAGLDPEQWPCAIVDGRLAADPVTDLLDTLPGAEVLGMGVLTGRPISGALDAARAARARHPRLRIVWGGWHPSLFPRQCLEEAPIDAVVVGAGQESFAALLAAWRDGRDPGLLPGVHVKRPDGSIGVGPEAPLPALDGLPPLDYGRLDLERYFLLKGKRQIDYIGSVGCNFRCAFCADPQVYRRQWTGLDPIRMATEVGDLVEGHRCTEVAFQDETFFTHRPRVESFCQAVLRRGLRFRWNATLRADQGARLPLATLELCRRAGFERAIVGVESADPEMLRAIQKDVRMDQVWKTAERLCDLGLSATWNFIVGFAGEPEASVVASLDCARRLRAMSPRFDTPIFFYKPYPGSPTAEAVERAGFPLPALLQEWAQFDYVGSGGGAWMPRGVLERVERFRFYQAHAYGPRPPAWRLPLRAASRVRVQRGEFRWPVEKWLAERLRPQSTLS